MSEIVRISLYSMNRAYNGLFVRGPGGARTHNGFESPSRYLTLYNTPITLTDSET